MAVITSGLAGLSAAWMQALPAPRMQANVPFRRWKRYLIKAGLV
jgi:hypothetical protein